MLADRYDVPFLQSALLPRAAWKPFPPAVEREAWEGLTAQPLNIARRAMVLAEAEALLGEPWPALPASLYMEFARNGNRSRYEQPYFARRQRLARLVLAEAFEYQGRFLDDIINGLWLISEEATWCIPAHAQRLPDDALPRQDLESVDLFACETAMVLAEARYLLFDALYGVSPALVDRLDREIQRRVVVPVETRDDFWWLSGRNNWSPWCAANTLGAAMYLLDDTARLAALIHKLMDVVDRFIATYGEDGGCDEGPSYWTVAAGAMLLFLEHLHGRTDGAVDIYDVPRIRAMGRYFPAAHLDGPWVLNFADAPAKLSPPRAVVYRYGVRIGDAAMRNLALLGMRKWDPAGPVAPPLMFSGCGGSLTHALRELFWMPADTVPAADTHDTSVWLPDLQVMIARESSEACSGLTVAAKGGHNDENHNHNDIGHVVIMLDGQPAIIDIGVETYTQQTFSPQRYELWCIRASGHNTPLVNGVEQAPGRERRATRVEYTADGAVQRLALNLEEAYPPEAGLVSLRRTVTLDAAAHAVILADAYALRSPAPLTLTFYTPVPVEVLSPGTLALATAPRRLLLRFDPAAMQATVETLTLADPNLQASWGKALTRITLIHPGGETGEYAITFTPER
ncbi:MAG: Heparinase II/III-like protein [bacterium ADurb.Bin429]|nr:MAG: Heparinase II/III-like protein [bacterium ADurb.Bin429]